MDEFYCGEETDDFSLGELFFPSKKRKSAFIAPKVLRKFRRFRTDPEMPRNEDNDYDLNYGWTSEMDQLMGKRLPDNFAFNEHLDFYIQGDVAYTTLPEGEYTYVSNSDC